MNQKIKWFTLGIMTALVALGTWSYFQNQPSDAVREFPQETRDFLLQFMPWLKSARGTKIGPFAIVVPSKNSGPTEAIIWPQNGGYPQIFITEEGISLEDSKNKLFTFKFKKETGEFISYNLSPDILSGTSFFDNTFDGEYDVKLHMPQKSNLPEISIYYDSKWLPVVFKEKKKFIEVSGVLREIKLENLNWEFVD